MAVFTLPADATQANYEFETDLDGVAFRFSFKYNERDDSWNMNVLDVEGNILRAGIKVVTNWSMFLRWIQQGRPDGDVFSVALGGISRPATLGELGDGVVLAYEGES